MFDYIIDKMITPLFSCIGVGIVGCIGYLCKRKLDERKHRKLGVVIINSLLEEVRTGLDIIKNNQYNRDPPKKSWTDGMKTIPDEVMLIILKVSKGIKPESKFEFKDIKSHCKNYFEHITKDWKMNIQYYQGETEEVKKMLEQTISLLEKNSKKKKRR